MILYVQENNAMVRVRGESIEVRKQGALLYQVPLISLERLVIIGWVQVTTQTLHKLAERGTDVAYMRRNGRLSFTLHAVQAPSVFLRLAQYQRYMDETYRLGFAREMVRAKILSQVEWVVAQRWEQGEEAWKDDTERMKGLADSVS